MLLRMELLHPLPPSKPLMVPYCSERKPRLCTSPHGPPPSEYEPGRLHTLSLLLPPHGFGVLAQNIQNIPPWGFAPQLPLPRSLPWAPGRRFPPSSETLL